MNRPWDAVIGVWDGHDAGATLVVDGQVVLALNEERLSGRKLDVGLPGRAIAAMPAPKIVLPPSEAPAVRRSLAMLIHRWGVALALMLAAVAILVLLK